METRKRRVVIAADNEHLRSLITRRLERAGYQPMVLKGSHEVRRMTISDDVVVLETNDDVAALSQIVYELYRAWRPARSLPIIALLSGDALRRNPQVGFWDIEGHAALTALIPSDETDLPEMVALLIQRLLAIGET